MLSAPPPLRLADLPETALPRLSSGLDEFDRVLGGGFVPGSVLLLGGEPGIGKSTLLLQVSAQLMRRGRVLYLAGEESLEQVKLRATRLGITGDILLSREMELSAITALLAQVQPYFCVVDSIQTVLIDGSGGGIAQLRDSALGLTQAAKAAGCCTVLVGHVTKEGAVAGPKLIEHIVDVTLYLESAGLFRLIRCNKNRFGPTGELGVFEMREDGLIQVDNPSAAFLSERPFGVAGSVVAATIDGQRPLLLEVQALSTRSPLPNPRRVVVGLDSRRVDVIVAVLDQHLGLPTGNLDLYLNLAGGLRVQDPGLDLPIALALHSAITGQAIPADLAAFGEVGLAGEVRSVSQGIRRGEEAQRSGLRALGPPGVEGARGVRSLGEALRALHPPESSS